MPTAPLPDLFGYGPISDEALDQAIDRALEIADEAGCDASAILAESEFLQIPDPGELPEEQERKRPWAISDVSEAEWAMARYAKASAELEEAKALYVEGTKRLGDWLASVRRRPDAAMGFFGGHLQRFALERREKDDKLATLVLPSGKVGTTKHRPSVALPDARDELAEVGMWLIERDFADAVRIEPLASKVPFEIRTVFDRWVYVDLSCGHSVRWRKAATLWDSETGDPDECSKDQRLGVVQEHTEKLLAAAETFDWSEFPCAGCGDDVVPALAFVSASALDEQRLAVVCPETGEEPPGVVLVGEHVTPQKPKPL